MSYLTAWVRVACIVPGWVEEMTEQEQRAYIMKLLEDGGTEDDYLDYTLNAWEVEE